MHHGELILRQPRLDELFWICTFALCLIPWSLSRPYLGQEGMTAGILATLAVLAAVRVTLLKNWNIRRVAWTLDDNALKERQGGQELSVAESSLLLYVWTRTIWTKTPQRLAGVAIGPQRQASIYSLRQLSAALDQVRGVEPQV